ncbi:MAG: hypothetical protein M3N47_00235 [Chloroflexota bacterium]|nr:hypothetical protein [Chloroflexota bacterium]
MKRANASKPDNRTVAEIQDRLEHHRQQSLIEDSLNGCAVLLMAARLLLLKRELLGQRSHDPVGDLLRQGVFTSRHGMDRLDQLFGSAPLTRYAEAPAASISNDGRAVLMPRQRHDACPRQSGADLSRGSDPSPARHAHVDHDDVRTLLGGQSDRLLGVDGRAHEI